MTRHSKYTPEQIAKIEQLGARGMPDGEIARIVGVKLCAVSTRVYAYWKNEMKNKK